MGDIEGQFIPAGTSRPRPARLRWNDGLWLVQLEHESRSFDAADTGFSQRMATLPRRVEFADGSQFTTADNDGIDALLVDAGRRAPMGWVDRLERRWRWALLALLALPFVLWGLFSWGLPVLSGPIADAVPQQALVRLDRSLMDLLDDDFLKPSTLQRTQRDRVRALLESLPALVPVHLEFRSGGLLGANALALPGGTVVVTDELVGLARSDGELVAVLGHEIGHVEGRHALRNIVQSVGAGAVLGWIFGDLTLVTDWALVSAPALLQQLDYSRDFERAADRRALEVLRQTGRSPACFGAIMERLQQQAGAPEWMPKHLSSHPDTDQRIAASASDRPCAD